MMAKRKVTLEVDVSFTKKRKHSIERSMWISKYNGNIPLMQCVQCKEMKELTTDYFSAANVQGDFALWFNRRFPSFHNSASYPCLKCRAANVLGARKVDDNIWLKHIMARYPKLGGVSWALKQYSKPVGTENCWASGCTLPFQKVQGNSFMMSVNSKLIQREKYNWKIGHDMQDAVGVYAWTNCAQSVNGPLMTKVTIIPCLRTAYTELYKKVIESYELGREVMIRCGKKRAVLINATADFNNMVQAAKKRDKKQGLNNNMCSLRILSAVRKQHVLCCTTGILMTSPSTCGGVRGPFDIHMDRIHDRTNSETPKGHTLDNVEFKCRLFNNDYQISRKDFLLVFLNQLLVPLPPRIRALVQTEYQAIPCSSRDAWRHEAVLLTRARGNTKTT